MIENPENILTNPYYKNLLLTEQQVFEIIKDKSILILGSAPSVELLTADFMESFNLIVRINNYRVFNECARTDIYYSMLGGSIKKSCADLKNEGCKFIFAKNPFGDYIVNDKNGKINILKSLRFEATYRRWREHWFELPYYLQTIENWRWLNDQIGQITTTGLSAIVDIYRFNPSNIHLAGFDFFSSGMHNGYFHHLKPWPKHHDFKGEMLFLRNFISTRKNITCDNTMQKIFFEPDKFPKIGSKPECPSN
jgi:hypothetical protein